MKNVFESILNQIKKQQNTVLVTIVAGSGSTPRGAGARMWVSEDGSYGGTIGGGNVEYQAFLRAKEVLKEKVSTVKGFNLSQGDTANIGMICGGQVVVCFQYIPYHDQKVKLVCETILNKYKEEKAENIWLIMDITDETVWEFGLYGKSTGLVGIEIDTNESFETLCSTKACRKQLGDKIYYSEPVIQAGTVYIFGAGHVARELVPVLTHLEFRCVVLDDREELLNDKDFPSASRQVLCNFKQIDEVVKIGKEDYMVIMTRGHEHDYVLQSQALKIKPKYIGIIGSRNKIAIITKKLLGQGFEKEEINQCHMPIGLDIKAETPAEIAISIAAELIQIRKGN